MIIDTKKIEKLLGSPISGDQIEANTSIGKKTIWNYRNGKAKLDNMTIGNAYKLCLFWDENGGKEMIDVNIKGVKSAVGDFNHWQGSAVVYLDKKEMKVWTNIYAGPGQWDDYHDNNIVEIFSKATNNMAERDLKITMIQLKEMCAEWLIV